MAHTARKTEHSGSKKGRGAFYGRKAAAKKESNHLRRQSDKIEARVATSENGRRSRPASPNERSADGRDKVIGLSIVR